MKHNLCLVIWIFAWSGSMLLVDKAVLYQWFTEDWMPIAGLAVSSVLGLGLIFEFIRFLNSQDELQRKIQMDALALSVGITLIGGSTYSLLATLGLIADAEASDVTMLLCFAYGIGVLIGVVRYK